MECIVRSVALTEVFINSSSNISNWTWSYEDAQCLISSSHHQALRHLDIRYDDPDDLPTVLEEIPTP
jgi:hypothetical protein